MSQLPNSVFNDLVQAYDESDRHSLGLWAVASTAYALGYREHEKRIEAYPLGQQVKEAQELTRLAEEQRAAEYEELRGLRSKVNWLEAAIRSQEAEIKKLDAKRSDSAGEAGS